MYLKSLSAIFGEGSIDHENKTVRGIFTDDNVDEHGHMIDRAAMEKAVGEYRQWGNVRDMHGKPVGIAESIGEETWNTVVAKIFDDEVWKMIVNRVYKGFSIGAMVTGGKMVKVSEITEEKFAGVSSAVRGAIKRAGEVFVITELTLVEVSVVDRPANPRAMFAKSIDGTEVMALPSVTKRAGVDAIKSMIIGIEDEDSVGEVDPVEEKAMEESMEDVQDEVVAADAEAVDTEAEVEVVAEVEVEDEVVVEVEKSMDADEPTADEEEDEIDEVVEPVVAEAEEVTEEVTDSAEEPAVEVQKLIDAVAVLTGVVEKLISQVAEVGTKSVSLDDEQIGKLADMVSEKVIVRRKSAVYGADNEGNEEPEAINLKSLNVDALSSLIVNSVARRAVKN